MSDINYDVENSTEDVNPSETKAEKFKRLATQRTQKTLHSIESLSNLSSSAYEYTPEQVESIFTAIEEAVADAKKKFEKTGKKKAEFTL